MGLGLAERKTSALPPTPGRSRVRLDRECHHNLTFWRSILEKTTGPEGAGTLDVPLLIFYVQNHLRTLISDASGDAMGVCLETGLWWRIDFDNDTRKRLRAHVQGRDYGVC